MVDFSLSASFPAPEVRRVSGFWLPASFPAPEVRQVFRIF
jgi:hypothetical protein